MSRQSRCAASAPIISRVTSYGAPATTQREAAVAAARPLGDPPVVHEADAEPGLGERERTRAPGDATADHDGVDGIVMWLRTRNRRLVEPVRDHRAIVEVDHLATVETAVRGERRRQLQLDERGGHLTRTEPVVLTSSSAVARAVGEPSGKASASGGTRHGRLGRWRRLDPERLEHVAGPGHRCRAESQERVRARRTART